MLSPDSPGGSNLAIITIVCGWVFISLAIFAVALPGFGGASEEVQALAVTFCCYDHKCWSCSTHYVGNKNTAPQMASLVTTSAFYPLRCGHYIKKNPNLPPFGIGLENATRDQMWQTSHRMQAVSLVGTADYSYSKGYPGLLSLMGSTLGIIFCYAPAFPNTIAMLWNAAPLRTFASSSYSYALQWIRPSC
ncbi:hypothetical protein HYFRA_00007780 [Hymenoscyphus fraxineus]|uniref:Uncharacterized protein n=1 Tax=Hymenoscyphus fraxineus TaxID=746836 RepID=A0A9N9KM64_9HELO|nr:hypothetical protein HYFRA_00007780 [Hymenoscyphus fraxineus]